MEERVKLDCFVTRDSAIDGIIFRRGNFFLKPRKILPPTLKYGSIALQMY
jgi:hypothetical protein